MVEIGQQKSQMPWKDIYDGEIGEVTYPEKEDLLFFLYFHFFLSKLFENIKKHSSINYNPQLSFLKY